ncbi:hypothetical protein F0562_007770 [Nyssa sinensis]|uniref:Uncharacterized protein n=1 Tax=Nyssa sinensis TaxID=561372 RepID=A0A5J5A6N7_9ASTE|nr:hypothetical protein F0562_007770 [Nyssa sinensis]
MDGKLDSRSESAQIFQITWLNGGEVMQLDSLEQLLMVGFDAIGNGRNIVMELKDSNQLDSELVLQLAEASPAAASAITDFVSSQHETPMGAMVIENMRSSKDFELFVGCLVAVEPSSEEDIFLLAFTSNFLKTSYNPSLVRFKIYLRALALSHPYQCQSLCSCFGALR